MSSKLPITICPDGVGSFNNPGNSNGGLPPPVEPSPYVPPDPCVGEWDLLNTGDDRQQEQYAEEQLNISGAPLNVFKLLGIHEQGKLIDLVGNGHALNGSAAVFDSLAPSWVSVQTGSNVVGQAWIGYDFGVLKTTYGQSAYAPDQVATQHITSFRITQPVANRRALQVRVERSNGGYKAGPQLLSPTPVPGAPPKGTVVNFNAGTGATPGMLMLTALGAGSFSVYFLGQTAELLGIAIVGQRFNSTIASFTVMPGTSPFVVGDMISMQIELDWYRVDVVNLPDAAGPILIRLKQSSPSRYWRIVPLSFSGVTLGEPWEVDKLELFDYQTTRLDDVQDQVFLENRDRDYARQSIQLRAAYQPFDSVSDLSKFGFQITDTYSFTIGFAAMVRLLGRPIVVGDVIELPSELEYDHNLRPVRKFLEVSDVGWAADGYSTQWRAFIFKFQASQLIPSQEHRDLLGTVDTQKYAIDDSTFFDGIQQLQTGQLTSNEAINEEARLAAPEKGTDTREFASGTNRFNEPGTYDGTGVYVEDGLPPDALPYTEGFVLPDVAGQQDGTYFRLNYDPKMKIASRLYKFTALKNKWIYVETDRRGERSSHKPSQREIFNQPIVQSLTTKRIT